MKTYELGNYSFVYESREVILNEKIQIAQVSNPRFITSDRLMHLKSQLRRLTPKTDDRCNPTVPICSKAVFKSGTFPGQANSFYKDIGAHEEQPQRFDVKYGFIDLEVFRNSHNDAHGSQP